MRAGGSVRVSAWPAHTNRTNNPYNQLLYAHLAELGVHADEFAVGKMLRRRYQIWHVHWPETPFNKRRKTEALLRLLVFAGLLSLAKARGTRIIWTCHNLRSHSRLYPGWEARFWKYFIPCIDGVISLSHSGSDLAVTHYPGLSSKPIAVIPHGHYMDVYPNDISTTEARKLLGLTDGEKVLLYLGHISPYKNVPRLLHQFRRMNDANLRLVIAGSAPTMELRSQIEREAASDSRIQLHLCFIEPQRLQVFLNAADVVVLPYKEILNSGTALLALSFLRPVLVPEKGAMADLRSTFGDSVVMTYHGELTVDALWSALESADQNPLDRMSLERHLRDTLDWRTIAERTGKFYTEIVGAGDIWPRGANEPEATTENYDSCSAIMGTRADCHHLVSKLEVHRRRRPHQSQAPIPFNR